MATHTLSRTDIGTTFTLAPGVVEVVEFPTDLSAVEIIVEGATEPVFYTLDGDEPTVGGSDCYRIPAGDWVDNRDPWGAASTVKLISTAAATVTVQRGY